MTHKTIDHLRNRFLLASAKPPSTVFLDMFLPTSGLQSGVILSSAKRYSIVFREAVTYYLSLNSLILPS